MSEPELLKEGYSELCPWDSMSKYLVIVESPTKARTISSILGKEYEVASSMGHVVDLPTTKLSVDIDNNFNPVFRIMPGKKKIISELQEKAKGKTTVYLATDPDREGEAISWHIKERLSEVSDSFKRVVFHEITEEALKKAFASPGELDMHKVNAQIARRVLDRIVGYSLSPILWRTIVRGLSAGRVQSIALKFIVERERNVLSFVPQTTYSLEATFRVGQESFKAKLTKYPGAKTVFDSKEEAQSLLQEIRKRSFLVQEQTAKETLRKPPSPHITSLLQQDAFSQLRFSAQRTMIVAQSLYEGVSIQDKSIGLITYMRTDSFHVSPKAKNEAKDFIAGEFGADFVASHEYHYKKKKGAQLAHEAIRPTSVFRKPSDIASYLSLDEARLYELVWRRFVSSLMKEAAYENTKVIIASDGLEFTAEGRKVLFQGFLKVLGAEADEVRLPPLAKGQALELVDLEIVEHTTKPPARYNDASLVRLLEEKGIGRPSTYAPIIFTLIKRLYIRREKRSFAPTDLGIKVCDLLVNFFPQIMDEGFTASLEESLDEVEDGAVDWHKILSDFYPPFQKKVETALGSLTKEVEYSDKTCKTCGAKLVIKWSRRGRFLSCERFPKCRYAESITSGVACPDCKEGQLIERRNKRGQNFYGCSRFPQCRYTARNLPESETSDDREPDTGIAE